MNCRFEGRRRYACALAAALFLSAPALAGTASYSYDVLGRLTQVVFSDGTSTTTIKYTYDAAGNRTSVVTTKTP